MRLLIATPLYPPESGGPATYSKALEDGLPSRGTSVVLVKFGDVRRQPKFIRHISYFFRVYRAAKDADLVLALDPVSTGLPACLAATLRRKPFVVKVVGDYAWEQGRQRFGIWLSLDEFVQTRNVHFVVALLRLVQTYVARRAVRVMVPSDYLKGIVSVWGIDSEKIEVIYNAVPNDEAGTLPEKVRAASRPRIVTAGRLVPWKGMPGVISALTEIRKEIPSATLVIVGAGPDSESLQKFAEAREPGNVLFTGALEHSEALAVIKDADIFVLNSTYEGLSHFLIEALSLGKAIVATRAGGNPEVVTHEEAGLLIPVGDSNALAQACVKILHDSTLRTELEQGALHSAARFSQETMLEATNTLLTHLV